MDREYDDNKMFLKLDEMKQDYVIRLTSKRKVLYHNKWTPVTELRDRRKGKIKMKLRYHDNTRAKSYHEFCKRYALEVGYKISMKNIGESKIERTRTVSLPLYLVWNWKRYL